MSTRVGLPPTGRPASAGKRVVPRCRSVESASVSVPRYGAIVSPQLQRLAKDVDAYGEHLQAFAGAVGNQELNVADFENMRADEFEETLQKLPIGYRVRLRQLQKVIVLQRPSEPKHVQKDNPSPIQRTLVQTPENAKKPKPQTPRSGSSAGIESIKSDGTDPRLISTLERRLLKEDYCKLMPMETKIKEYAVLDSCTDDSDAYAKVMLQVYRLFSKLGPESAALCVIAPQEALHKLRVETVDDGTRSEQLKGVTVFDNEFERFLAQFSAHHERDRDEHGLPTDGGFAASHRKGRLLIAAAKFLEPPNTSYNMRNSGTRHEAGLSVATRLREMCVNGPAGVVFVRSQANIISMFPASPITEGLVYREDCVEPEAIGQKRETIYHLPMRPPEPACTEILDQLCSNSNPTTPTRIQTIELQSEHRSAKSEHSSAKLEHRSKSSAGCRPMGILRIQS